MELSYRQDVCVCVCVCVWMCVWMCVISKNKVLTNQSQILYKPGDDIRNQVQCEGGKDTGSEGGEGKLS